jgi:hypothetical protein
MRARARSLALLASGLLACPGPQEPAGPNGKQGVLFFFPDTPGPVAQGLEMEVLLPGSLTSTSGRHHLEYDFEGTTLEVEADAGVSVGAAWRHGRSWRFTYRCEPSPEGPAEDTGEREVRVRVRAPDGAERYADALAVRCRRPTALLLQDVSPWSASPRGDGVVLYAVGAQLRLYPRMAPDLVGRGPGRLEDPQGVARPVEALGPVVPLGTPLVLETVRPGAGLTLHLGGLVAPLPVEVVEPAAVRFGLKVRHEKDRGWFVRAGAVLARDGSTEVGGWGPCALEVRPFLEKSTTLPSACVTWIADSASRGEVCATFQGQRVCEDFSR